MMLHPSPILFLCQSVSSGLFRNFSSQSCLTILFFIACAGCSGQPNHRVISAQQTTPRCPLLIPPANTAVAYWPPTSDLADRTVATYSCLAGYERFGAPANRTCQQGKWTGQAPICANNIAIRQTATQSSNSTEFTTLQGTRQAYDAAAYLAVDGTRIYCSKTTPEPQPKWQLTFAQNYSIVAVRIYGDVLRETNDLEVSLLPADTFSTSTADPQTDSDEREKSVCRLSSPTTTTTTTTTTRTTTGAEKTVNENVTLYLCNASFLARRVLIRRPAYASLRLCEVEVFSQQGVPCQHPGSPANGIVKLSHVEWPFPPGAVAVYDCNSGYTRIPTEATYHRTCQINGTWDVREPVCVTNAAQYRPANQSSLFSSYNYPPWQAVDVDLNSCGWTRRENEPWWQVDLLKPYTIHAISVLLDKERLFYQFHRNLLISITNRSSDQVTAPTTLVTFRRTMLKDAGPGSGVFYMDRPVIGRFVTIFVAPGSTEKFLGICDVQVLVADETPATPDHCGLQTPPSSLLYTFKKTCYQVQRFSATNWYNAMLSCQDNGGSLISSPTSDTHIFLSNVLSSLYRFHTSDDRYWISAKMATADHKWNFLQQNFSTRVETFFWAPGRPINDGHGAYDSCVALGGHGASNWSWADYRCDQDAANWICAYGPKSCGDPVQPEASALLVADKIVGSTSWRIGDHVQYECAPGFVLTGDSAGTDSVCQTDGTWSGVTPNCRYVSCGEPPKRLQLFSTLLNGTTYYGSFAQYFCVESDSSRQVIGSSVIGCMANGSWEWLDFTCDTHLPHSLAGEEDEAPIDTASSLNNMHQVETVGVGVGVAVSVVILILLFLYCGIRYRRKKASEQAPIPARKRHSPYATIGRLQTSQISGPITVMQQPDTPHKQQALYDDLTPQVSTQVSISDESYSRSDPEGSLSPSNPSSTYLQSFGKAGLIKLYQKAKANGTLRGTHSDNGASQRARPRGPKLVISSPIECRKTVVLDSGTHYARTGMEVIYAQPARLRGNQSSENQYEYLETARIKGGFGSSEDQSDDGVYSDTTLSRSVSRDLARHSLPPVDEVYDDVRNATISERYIRC